MTTRIVAFDSRLGLILIFVLDLALMQQFFYATGPFGLQGFGTSQNKE